MEHGAGSGELVGCHADERLLAEDAPELPAAVGRPEPVAPSRARRRLVAAGATLTGVTLLAGIALVALGVIDAVSAGAGLRDLGAVLLGCALVGTHWGWVHVAEAGADALERRRDRDVRARRLGWLAAIEPYARHEVTTRVGDDGAIHVVCVRYRPVRSGERSFRFVRETVAEEAHPGDASAAIVAERAEALRREAALRTARERERYEAATTVHEAARREREDDRRDAVARRATSQTLSDHINARLRDPPLDE